MYENEPIISLNEVNIFFMIFLAKLTQFKAIELQQSKILFPLPDKQ